MKLDFAARCEIGSARNTNDDRVLIRGEILDGRAFNGTADVPFVACVCDGCGGHKGGNVAAQTALEALASRDPEELKDEESVLAVLNDCSEAIKRKKSEEPALSEMCTTIAGCAFSDERIIIFHSGDSRVYRYDNWGFTQVTRDHSRVQEMIDSGEITPEEAAGHPRSNIITRCLGFNCPAPELYVSESPVNPGEKYLICSDGLWGSISEEEIKEVLDKDIPLQQAADELVIMALRHGSEDNISVCICASQEKAEKKEIKHFILD